jgi:hypothetical protein
MFPAPATDPVPEGPFVMDCVNDQPDYNDVFVEPRGERQSWIIVSLNLPGEENGNITIRAGWYCDDEDTESP